MISPTMALTAAHCVFESENRGDPNLTVRLNNGQRYGIKEFRTNDCWDFGSSGPFSADIAIMVLDRPIQGAVAGRDYVETWNAETMGDVEGKTFILAGWGASGEIREDGTENHLVYEIFHRGYNTVDQIRDNMLVYDFDRPDQAHDLEAMGHFGDSGSGAYIDIGGELRIAGVKSNGQDAFYGSRHEYTRVGGINLPWIEANLKSPGRKVSVETCSVFPGASNDAGQGGNGSDGDNDNDWNDDYGEDDWNDDDQNDDYGDDSGYGWDDDSWGWDDDNYGWDDDSWDWDDDNNGWDDDGYGWDDDGYGWDDDSWGWDDDWNNDIWEDDWNNDSWDDDWNNDSWENDWNNDSWDDDWHNDSWHEDSWNDNSWSDNSWEDDYGWDDWY